MHQGNLLHPSGRWIMAIRSEEHTSELQSRRDLVCRLLLEKKNLAHRDPAAAHELRCARTGHGRERLHPAALAGCGGTALRALVQRVSRSHVTVEGTVTGAIGTGLLVLLGVTHDDTEDDADKLAENFFFIGASTTEIYTSFPTRRSSD